jgi:hypothetical protein
MSLAQVLSHLRAGELIVVRDGDALLQPRHSTMSDGHAAADRNIVDSRELLRNLIAVRKFGRKK